MDYTVSEAAGQTLPPAESNAKPGQVLVSETVYKEVAGRIPLEPMGEISVKGKSKPVKIFQLVRDEASSAPASKEAAAATETKKDQ